MLVTTLYVWAVDHGEESCCRLKINNKLIIYSGPKILYISFANSLTAGLRRRLSRI